MRTNAALQVLGFLLSLARGSEVGNSQAGKRRASTGRLGTWGPKPSARSAGGRGRDWSADRAGWDHLARGRPARVLRSSPRTPCSAGSDGT